MKLNNGKKLAYHTANANILTNIRTKFKFIFFSLFGVMAFFYSFEFRGNDTFLVEHLSIYIRETFQAYIPFVALFIAFIAISEIIQRKPKCVGSPSSIVLSVIKILGFTGLIMGVFNIGPGILMDPDVIPFVLGQIISSITVTILVAALVLPFILDYGLVDFVGILMQSIMRPLFKTPGSSAMIAVTAFLGNFSVGHIAINQMFTEGKLTSKEAAIMGTSFCTASIPFLLVIADIIQIMDYWVLYFWSAVLITLLTSLVVVRLWPLSSKNDYYYESATPQPEPTIKTNIFKNAVLTGLKTAEQAEPLQNRLWALMKESTVILSSIVVGAMFFGTLGILIEQYTNFITYVGYIFLLPLQLINIPDVGVIANAAAVSVLEITLPAIIGIQSEAALAARFVIALIPVSAIVFLAGFVPSIISTKIPVTIPELIVLWLERTFITVILGGILALILF